MLFTKGVSLQAGRAAMAPSVHSPGHRLTGKSVLQGDSGRQCTELAAAALPPCLHSQAALPAEPCLALGVTGR